MFVSVVEQGCVHRARAMRALHVIEQPSMNSDISALIMQFAADAAVNTRQNNPFLHTLRAVNRQFRDIVDHAAVLMLSDAHGATTAALEAPVVSVAQLYAARDRVSKYKFVAIQLLSEVTFRGSMLSFLRLRTGKHPRDTPGMPAVCDRRKRVRPLPAGLEAMDGSSDEE